MGVSMGVGEKTVDLGASNDAVPQVISPIALSR